MLYTRGVEFRADEADPYQEHVVYAFNDEERFYRNVRPKYILNAAREAADARIASVGIRGSQTLFLALIARSNISGTLGYANIGAARAATKNAYEKVDPAVDPGLYDEFLVAEAEFLKGAFWIQWKAPLMDILSAVLPFSIED